jgi:two-component system, OmpR family, phosphate regulon response regulator PhoB
MIEEPCVRDVIAANLHAIGWFSVAALTAREGWRLASQVLPDVVVMDIDSPATADCYGLFKLARSNASSKTVRTVLLSSARDFASGSEGIHAGADLRVGKPLNASDLTARLVQMLRPQRSLATLARPTLRFGSIELDRHQPTVRVWRTDRWLTLALARTEHRLLECMLCDPARVHSRESLRDAVWPDATVELRTVDQYVRRLRRSLGGRQVDELIGTVVGVGYRLRLELVDGAPT